MHGKMDYPTVKIQTDTVGETILACVVQRSSNDVNLQRSWWIYHFSRGHYHGTTTRALH